MHSLDTLEHLIFECTDQCDLVLRRVMSYLGPAESLKIKAALTQEWHDQYIDENPDEYDECFDDFYLYEEDDE